MTIYFCHYFLFLLPYYNSEFHLLLGDLYGVHFKKLHRQSLPPVHDSTGLSLLPQWAPLLLGSLGEEQRFARDEQRELKHPLRVV